MSVVERALEKLRRAGNASSLASSEATIARAQSVEPPTSPDIENLQEPQVFVDRVALRMAGYLPESNQDRRFADEYRRVKRPLVAAAFGAIPEEERHLPSPRLVMMASALPGDGKTFTSINLALSLAREKDSSVVLVDGDVAKPHVSSIFGVESHRGLLDLLADSSLDVADVILRTDCRGLSLLPAGKAQEGTTELMSSGRMKEIANQIIALNPRCIALFDSSPLLVSSESLALASAMGQFVLVVRAGRTPRHAVVDAVESLGVDRRIGLVLNQGRRGLADGRYGYGYDYGYGDKSGSG